MQSKLSRYSFWTGLISAIVLLIETIASLLGAEISTDTFVSLGNAILGTLVVLGIITKDKGNNSNDGPKDI